jgi:hypothetical protein
MTPNEASGRSSEPAPIPASKLIFILIQYSFHDSGHKTTTASSLCTVDDLYLFFCYLWIYRSATKVKNGSRAGGCERWRGKSNCISVSTRESLHLLVHFATSRFHIWVFLWIKGGQKARQRSALLVLENLLRAVKVRRRCTAGLSHDATSYIFYTSCVFKASLSVLALSHFDTWCISHLAYLEFCLQNTCTLATTSHSSPGSRYFYHLPLRLSACTFSLYLEDTVCSNITIKVSSRRFSIYRDDQDLTRPFLTFDTRRNAVFHLRICIHRSQALVTFDESSPIARSFPPK